MTTFPIRIVVGLTDWQPGLTANWAGPFVNGTDTYIFGRGFGSGDDQKIRILKSADFADETSWALMTPDVDPRGIGQIQNASCVQVGTKIHCVFTPFGTVGLDVYYSRFDMALDQWDEIDTTQIEVLITNPDPVSTHCDLAVRSDGSLVVTYPGPEEKVHGVDWARVFFSVSSDGGQTWSAGASLQNGGETDRVGGRILYNADTDDCHILVNDIDGTTASVFQITLNSSDALQSYTDTGEVTENQAGGGEMPFAMGIVANRDAGDNHSRCLMLGNQSPLPANAPTILEFDSVADPASFASTELDPDRMQDSSGTVIAVLQAFSNGQFIAVWVRVNPVAPNFTEVFWSTDDGGDTWETAEFVAPPGQTAVDGRIIDRGDGAGEKLAIMWGDSATIQYMEIEPNDFSPTSLDELSQPPEGYTLAPVIV